VALINTRYSVQTIGYGDGNRDCAVAIIVWLVMVSSGFRGGCMFFNIAYLVGGIAMLYDGITLIASLQLGAILFGILAVCVGLFFLLLGIAGVVLEFRKHQL
jgi:hypothetical protein